jgi:hypothetical protein
LIMNLNESGLRMEESPTPSPKPHQKLECKNPQIRHNPPPLSPWMSMG